MADGLEAPRARHPARDRLGSGTPRRAGLAAAARSGRADRYLIDEVLRHRRAEVAAADY